MSTDNDKQTKPKQAVSVLQPSRLPIAPQVAKEFNLDATQWRVLVDQIFPAAKTVEAVTMALSYCRARKLDIYKRPVHIVPMYSTALKRMVETVWPGIAEIRTTAARTGEYAGIEAVQFGDMIENTFEGTTGNAQYGEESSIRKTVTYPEWASVVVYRMIQGQRVPFHAIVFWEETYATIGKTEVPNDMWAKRPRGQLMKCVEAAALRMAFPEEIGNTYAAEEMEGRTIDAAPEGAAIPQQSARPLPPPPPPEEEEPAEPQTPTEAAQASPDATSAPAATSKPAEGNTVAEVKAERASKPAPAATKLAEDATPPAPPAPPEDDGTAPDTSDAGRFLHQIDETLATAADDADLTRLWDELEVQHEFADDEDALTRAFEIKKRHTARIERVQAIAAGQGSMFDDELPEATKQAVRLGNTP